MAYTVVNDLLPGLRIPLNITIFETLVSSFLFRKPVQSNLREVSIYFDIHVYSHDEWMETTYGTRFAKGCKV